MENSTPRYQGKPTAYLDHNILDLLVKNSYLTFGAELKEQFQIIYSDENLKEIKRTGENGSTIGSFADYFFSRDIAFVKKTRACYEFLNTKAQVIEVAISDE